MTCCMMFHSVLKAEILPVQAGEAALAAMAKDDVQALLTVLFLLIESAALIQMTQSELAGAQKLILLLVQLLKGFPGLLRRLVPSMHMLAGEESFVAHITPSESTQKKQVSSLRWLSL